MEAEQQELEVRGDDVELAIEAGLAQLGVSRDEVSVEILDEGSSGFLGLGSRDAIVRLTVKDADPGQTESVQEAAVAVEEQRVESAVVEPVGSDKSVEMVGGAAEEGETALEIVNTLLSKMQVEAQTSLRLSEADDLTGERRWVVDIEGKDLGVLIGPRGETLNALQYVSRLMTGHRLHERPYFIVDIEGYRSRREQALARLAERMAKKVEARGKALNLEPMPPNERRIIHMTLRDHDRVMTQSRGEGSRRQVRISLKR